MTEPMTTTSASQSESRQTTFAACIVLAATMVFGLWWSHVKPLWGDELLEFYSDSRSSFATVLAGQLRYPFSLEPPAFHLLLHFFGRIGNASPEFAIRFISLISLLVTEICIYRCAKKVTENTYAAVLAMTCPLLFSTFDFAAEARVYSLLTACFALAFIAYQSAQDEARPRTGSLLLLFATCGAAILLHYYGILLPLPFFAGELVKATKRRPFDWPVLFALAGAMALFTFNLPFMPVLSDIRAHYYSGTEAEGNWVMIPVTYMWLFTQYAFYEKNNYGNVLRFIGIIITLLGVPVVAVLLSLRQKRHETAVPSAIFIALVCGALLPVFNVVIGHYKTHAYVLRYSLPAVVPLSILIAMFVAPYLRSSRRFIYAQTFIFLLASMQAIHDIRHEKELTAKTIQDLADTQDLHAALRTTADQHIYVQNVAKFLTTYYYEPPQEQKRLIGFQSLDREVFWLHRGPSSLFLRNMHCSTALPVSSLASIANQPGPHLLVVFEDPKEEWIGMELNDTARAERVEPMGHAYGGRLLRVTFAPHPGMPDDTYWQCPAGNIH